MKKLLEIPLYGIIISIPLSKILPILSIIDEIIIVALVFYIIVINYNKLIYKNILKKSGLYFLAFVLLTYPYSYKSDIYNIILSLLFFSKLHIMIIYLNLLRMEQVHNILKFLVIFTLIGILFQLFFPEHHFSLLTRELNRGDLSIILSGFQANPNYLAFTLGLIFVTVSKNLFSKLIVLFVLIMTGSRTGLVFALLSLVGINIRESNKLYIYFATPLLISLSIIGLYSFGLMDRIVHDFGYFYGDLNENLYIRGIMVKMSFLIFSDYFPLGVGLSHYGTPYSWDSLVYTEYGVDNLIFFKEYSTAVFDSAFASLLGTGGLLGFIVFFLSLYWLIQENMKNKVVTFYLLFIILLISIFTPLYGNAYLALIIAIYYKVLVNKGFNKPLESN